MWQSINKTSVPKSAQIKAEQQLSTTPELHILWFCLEQPQRASALAELESQGGSGENGLLWLSPTIPEHTTQDCIQLVLEHLQREKLHSPSGQTVPRSSSSCPGGISSCLFVLCHAWAPWKRAGSLHTGTPRAEGPLSWGPSGG